MRRVGDAFSGDAVVINHTDFFSHPIYFMQSQTDIEGVA